MCWSLVEHLANIILRSVSDKSIRYVAAQNIKLVSAGYIPSNSMMRLAGRYFKRWDHAKGIFVSNVRDEYPDD
jgi:F-box protein 21